MIKNLRNRLRLELHECDNIRRFFFPIVKYDLSLYRGTHVLQLNMRQTNWFTLLTPVGWQTRQLWAKGSVWQRVWGDVIFVAPLRQGDLGLSHSVLGQGRGRGQTNFDHLQWRFVRRSCSFFLVVTVVVRRLVVGEQLLRDCCGRVTVVCLNLAHVHVERGQRSIRVRRRHALNVKWCDGGIVTRSCRDNGFAVDRHVGRRRVWRGSPRGYCTNSNL